MDGFPAPISPSISRRPGHTKSPTNHLPALIPQVVSMLTRMATGCRMRGSAFISTRQPRQRAQPIRITTPSTTSPNSSVAVILRNSTNPPWVLSGPTMVGTGPPAICAISAMAFGRWLFRSSNLPRVRIISSVSGRPKTMRTGDSRRCRNPMASNRTSIFSGRPEQPVGSSSASMKRISSPRSVLWPELRIAMAMVCPTLGRCFSVSIRSPMTRWRTPTAIKC